MRLRKILRGRGGLVACLGLAFVLGAATVGAVQTAGASGGIGTTYHACLLRGDLSKLGPDTEVSNRINGDLLELDWR